MITLRLFGILLLRLLLIIFVDDIMLPGIDIRVLNEMKIYLKRQFVTKDMGKPRYFFGIDVT